MSISNHNPGNIRVNRTFVWRGQTCASTSGFVVFRSPLYGLRAMARLWMTYETEHHAVSLRDYITRWAPPTENDTEAYIHAVGREVGVDPEAPIDIHARGLALLAAVVRHENGVQPYDDDLLSRAIALAHIV